MTHINDQIIIDSGSEDDPTPHEPRRDDVVQDDVVHGAAVPEETAADAATADLSDRDVISPPPLSSPPPAAPPPPPPPGTPPSASPSPPPPPPHSIRGSLRRSSQHRVVGGVAAGIAGYLDLDPVLVRIAFVALAFLGGSGIVLYLAGWLLIPADDTERAVAQDWLRPRSRGRSIAVITIGTVVGLIALSNLFSSGPWWPRWDGGVGGFGFFFGLFALVLAIGLIVSGMRGHRSPLLWVLVTALLSLVAIATVAAATVFSIEAVSGVPLRGGVGEVQWRPTAAAQVPANYRLAIGNMTVDLREVAFRPGTTHLTATVGIGHLVVEVPPGTAVSVSAHSGLGDVQVFGVNTGGYSTRQSAQLSGTQSDPATAAHLVLDAETGVGQVQVLKSS